MTSVQPLPQIPPFERPTTTSRIRFEFSPAQLESSLDEKSSPSSTFPLLSSNSSSQEERTVKISEYHPFENLPFQRITPLAGERKLHRFILLTPRTICSLSLFVFLSLAIISIGFGVVVSTRQAALSFQYSPIRYCPMNTSYTLTCNLTNEYCSCYDVQGQLLGCLAQRTHAQPCYRSQECSLQESLQCNLQVYQCPCLDHYYFNGNFCVPLLIHNATCSLSDDRCDQSLNLTCRGTNQCLCNTNLTFWNGEYCEAYRSVGYPCNPYQTPSGCSNILTCENTTATCQCPSSTYFDGEVCLKYSSYLEPCYDSSSCLPNSAMFCSWSLCLCDDEYFYWSSTLSRCVYPKQIQYNSTCDSQTACESDYGLRCIDGRCSCEINSYWAPGNYCDTQAQHDEQCATAPCQANTGLFCSASICTCPQCKVSLVFVSNMNMVDF